MRRSRRRCSGRSGSSARCVCAAPRVAGRRCRRAAAAGGCRAHRGGGGRGAGQSGGARTVAARCAAHAAARQCGTPDPRPADGERGRQPRRLGSAARRADPRVARRRLLVRTGTGRGAGAGRAGTGRGAGANHLSRAAAVRPGGRGTGRRLRGGAGGAASRPAPRTACHRDRLLACGGGRRTAARRPGDVPPCAARAGAGIRTARPGTAAAAPSGARHRRPPAGVPAPVERAPRRLAARLRRRHLHGGDAQPGAPRAARQAAWRRRLAACGDAPAGRRRRP